MDYKVMKKRKNNKIICFLSENVLSNTDWKYNIVQTSLRLFVLFIFTIGINQSMILHHVFGLSAISLWYKASPTHTHV